MVKRKESKNDELPEEVSAIRKEIGKFFDTLDDKNRKIGSSTHGIYAFFDYDQEPIYVGQTYEKLRGRVGHHLTNQRTDAVAMNVLDPFEVAEIEIWPLDDAIESLPASENTIANLARVISERSVSKGLRRTLLTQARRLELLASRRLDELGIEDPSEESNAPQGD